jgi:hypothetical protein
MKTPAHSDFSPDVQRGRILEQEGLKGLKELTLAFLLSRNNLSGDKLLVAATVPVKPLA